MIDIIIIVQLVGVAIPWVDIFVSLSPAISHLTPLCAGHDNGVLLILTSNGGM